MKALIMLGINGGYGNADVARLTVAGVDLENGVITCPRGKTEAFRRVPLWPETVDALRPLYSVDRELMLVNERGQPLVRRGCNDICRWMRDLSAKLGSQITYYGFRYTFSTVASETGDDHARNLIMGHTINGVPENYVRRFPEERLLKVSNHVHAWLFATTSPPVRSTSPSAEIDEADVAATPSV